MLLALADGFPAFHLHPMLQQLPLFAGCLPGRQRLLLAPLRTKRQLCQPSALPLQTATDEEGGFIFESVISYISCSTRLKPGFGTQIAGINTQTWTV
jgi:hypothetical protein